MKVQARGITQNVHVWGPEDGTPVLLIHGNCSSGAYWEPFVRLLLADGGSWRVVAPDLRGYGDTDPAPVDSTRGLRDFADDVAALLPLVFPPGSRPIVAGHSMGGGVAMHLTIAHPPRWPGCCWRRRSPRTGSVAPATSPARSPRTTSPVRAAAGSTPSSWPG